MKNNDRTTSTHSRRNLIFAGLGVAFSFAMVLFWSHNVHNEQMHTPAQKIQGRSVTSDSTPTRSAQQPRDIKSQTPKAVPLSVLQGTHTDVPIASTHITVRIPKHFAAAEAWLEERGSTILRQSPYTERYFVSIPGDTTARHFANELAALPVFGDARVDPLMHASNNDNPSPMPYQWHLPAVQVPQMWDMHQGEKNRHCDKAREVQRTCLTKCKSGSKNLQKRQASCIQEAYPQSQRSNVVIAVLDTGIAYEKHKDGTGKNKTRYTPSPDLKMVHFVQGYDFINLDDHANDDHRHGTHMANIIAGMGRSRGIALGASLMPVKVLDNTKKGTESALIEGILFAVNNGAHILNMSLTFPEGYQPSPDLEKAVQYAAEQGVVMVGASGNDGMDHVLYPAAFPEVIAVGAAYFDPQSESFQRAEYSNRGGALDLVAPGGDLRLDANQDNLPDGILAQSFPVGQPDKHTYWILSGTSPAAAQVSGVAATLLQAGAEPSEVRGLLTQYATPLNQENLPFDTNAGSGLLNAEASLNAVGQDLPEEEDFYLNAAVLLIQDDAESPQTRGKAYLEVIDENRRPVANARILGHWFGDANDMGECTTDTEGRCEIVSEASEMGRLFAFVPDRILDADHLPHNPQSFQRVDGITYRLLTSLGSGLTAQGVALRYSEDARNLLETDQTSLDTVNIKTLGTGLASSSIVMGFDFHYFNTSALSEFYMTFTTFGTGLASSSLIIDENFIHGDYRHLYDTSSYLIYNHNFMSGGVWSNGQSVDTDEFRQEGELGVLTMTTGTGLASSSLITNLSYWNLSAFSDFSTIDYDDGAWDSDCISGTGLASSSLITDFATWSYTGLSDFNMNNFMGDWTAGVGLASSSLIVDEPVDIQLVAQLEMESDYFFCSFSWNVGVENNAVLTTF